MILNFYPFHMSSLFTANLKTDRSYLIGWTVHKIYYGHTFFLSFRIPCNSNMPFPHILPPTVTYFTASPLHGGIYFIYSMYYFVVFEGKKDFNNFLNPLNIMNSKIPSSFYLCNIEISDLINMKITFNAFHRDPSNALSLFWMKIPS